MTRKYLLITAGREIHPDESRVVFVTIGTTAQANRDYLFLVGWAVQHGYFFELYSNGVADFLLRVQQSVKPNSLPVDTYSARDIVRCIKATNNLPSSQLFNRNDEHMRALMSTSYRVFKNLNRPPAKQSDV